MSRQSPTPPPGSASQPAPALELQLIPASESLPTSDSRWRNHVATLLTDLKRNAGEVRKEITPVPGQKGGAEAIILALGTSGAITAAVAVFRAWLARSADRSLTVKGRIAGREVDLQLTGSNIDEDTLRLALGLAKP